VFLNEKITDKHINAVQKNIDQALTQITNKDQLDTSILPNIILFPNIINKVPHTLGRKLSGWFIVRTHGSVSFAYDVQDANTSQDLTLWLMSPTQITVDIQVF
jgi:hypothetical protein